MGIGHTLPRLQKRVNIIKKRTNLTSYGGLDSPLLKNPFETHYVSLSCEWHKHKITERS